MWFDRRHKAGDSVAKTIHVTKTLFPEPLVCCFHDERGGPGRQVQVPWSIISVLSLTQ